jgi:hypothetical protein
VLSFAIPAFSLLRRHLGKFHSGLIGPQLCVKDIILPSGDHAYSSTPWRVFVSTYDLPLFLSDSHIWLTPESECLPIYASILPSGE